MNLKTTLFPQLIIILSILTISHCFYSKYYRKCKLFKTNPGKHISELKQERVITYPVTYYIEPLAVTRKPLSYVNIDYFYIEYIGAGGSGEVFLVEEAKTGQAKIFKRFFNEKIDEFQEENFVMHRLNYSVSWAKDTLNGIPPKTDDQKYKSVHKQIPTIAIYPAKQSLTLRDVEFYPHEAATIFYKILVELQKAHKSSLIHNDLKLGNIMVNNLGMNFKLFETQLIDWNLVTFYYLGQESNSRKGTTCYYSPEQLMKASFMTPAIDVWALAVVMWTFFTDDKPFFSDCKENNLEAIASLVGIDKLIQTHSKYSLPFTVQYYQLLLEHIQNPSLYKPRDLREAVPQEREDFFTDDLIDLFERMFVVDPEERITVSEVLKHKFFKNIKKIPPMYEEKKRAKAQKQKKKAKEAKNK